MAAFFALGMAALAAPPVETPRMELVEKIRLVEHRERRNIATGFLAYVDDRKPVLMHCFGWEDYSDGYDDYAVQTSQDNGRTWSEPVVRFRSTVTPRGRLRYAEPAAYWDRQRRKLIVLIDRSLYENDALHSQTRFEVVEHVYDAKTGHWSEERPLNLAPGRSLAVSFAFPIRTRKGSILVPACRSVEDEQGHIVVDPRSGTPVNESLTIIGRWGRDGRIAWRLGKPVPLDRATTTRGTDEHTYAELPDGRIAAVIRGSNAGAPGLPGHKWLSFSSDDGVTWTRPVPLCDTAGRPPESGANGSALVRHSRTGRLYWLGNLCREGEHAAGNAPRHTLMLVEVQEHPFALRMDRAFVVDRDGPGDSPDLQLSNFRWYEDRETGDLVIYLTRIAERGMARWQEADYYRYRVRIR